MAGYLFVHFTGEQQYEEEIYFSISRDGLHWKELKGRRPVLYSDIGEKGAFLVFWIPHIHTPDGKGGKFQIDRAWTKDFVDFIPPEKFLEREKDVTGTAMSHGGILLITDEEYERLEKAFDRINPILPGLFADPDIAVFDGKYYIYPTSDGYDNWSGSRFYVFSSEDGIHFKKGPLLLDVATEQVPWATGYAWAPCIARKGDTWYFYFCAKDQNGESCIGMAWAKHPEGPFTACEKPFITMSLAREWGLKMGYGGQTIDPSIYQEGEDFYLLFGNGHPAIGKLNEKMDGLVPGTIQDLEGLFDFREAVSVKKRDGLYHFTWSCDDTGSEDYHVNYGTAKELYGPVDYHYAILTKDPSRDIYGTGHHSIVQLPGSDCWKIAYHRFGTPTERYPEGKGFHRETCIADLEFSEDGLIKQVKMWD